MTSEQRQIHNNPDDVDMKEQSFVDDNQLTTSSSFHLTSPFNNNNNNTNNIAISSITPITLITPCKSSTPQTQTQTPSIPNTQLRNLTISTPIENKTENKDIEEIESNTNTNTNINTNINTYDSLINDSNSYISIIDNKYLAKISQTNPNRTYNRIQAKNINKFKTEIQSIMNNAIQRKKKKLIQNNNKNNKNSKVSDKQENDDDNDNDKDNDKNKNKTIPNEYKLVIIEKALAACYSQLINLNERFLEPVQNINNIKPQSNKQQISQNKKEIKKKIQHIKTQIKQRKEKLMNQIQMLNKLRSKTKQIEIEIPQNVKNKMVKNINYNNENNNNNNIMSPLKQEKTMEILAMINENKKKRMIELKSKFDQLKQNEIRLKKKAEKIKNDQDEINQFIQLKNQNMNKNDNNNNNNNNMEMDNNNNMENNNENKNRNIRVSMASSIESTIHGTVSSDIFDKFNRKQIKQKLSFIAIQNVFNGDPNLLQTIDIDL